MQPGVVAQPEDQGAVVVDCDVPIGFDIAALFDGDYRRAHLSDKHVVGRIQQRAGAADRNVTGGGPLGTIEIVREDRAAPGDVETGCARVASKVERVAVPK